MAESLLCDSLVLSLVTRTGSLPLQPFQKPQMSSLFLHYAMVTVRDPSWSSRSLKRSLSRKPWANDHVRTSSRTLGGVPRLLQRQYWIEECFGGLDRA
ncbi:hypothetical protein EDB85DRAFT_1955914 [Lactarius pseudohatsudake]|nr:hypothetical protein EDB85DRAFT_1955914 [Lactarius pseudohatsudake]